MTTLTGTWTGFLEFSPTTGPRQRVTILSAPLTQAGASLSLDLVSPTASLVRFSGRLQDPSAIGSTTGIVGTLTSLTNIGVGRGSIPCQGTTAFTGTANWTTISLTVPQIILDCGASPDITYTSVLLSLVKQQ